MPNLPQIMDEAAVASRSAELNRHELAALFAELLATRPVTAFFAAHPELSENQRGVLTFMHSLRNGSPNTIESYVTYLCEFLNAAGGPFSMVTVLDVEDFVDALLERGSSKATVHLALAAVRSFYKRMRKAGLCGVNPAELVSIPKIQTSERIAAVLEKSLSMDDVADILEQLEAAHNEISLRDLAMFYMMTRVGLRASEVCALTWGDLREVQGRLAVRIPGKGRKIRMVMIPVKGVEYLLRLREAVHHVPAYGRGRGGDAGNASGGRGSAPAPRWGSQPQTPFNGDNAAAQADNRFMLKEFGPKMIVTDRHTVNNGQAETEQNAKPRRLAPLQTPERLKPLPLFGRSKDPAHPMKRHNVNRIIGNIAQLCGPRHFSPHALRHTCFTHMVHLGTPINEVRLAAGHESIATTMIYIDAGKVLAGGTSVFDG